MGLGKTLIMISLVLKCNEEKLNNTGNTTEYGDNNFESEKDTEQSNLNKIF